MFFENLPCKALYSGKMGFGMAPRQCEICSKPQPLLQKTCLSYASKRPTYIGQGLPWSFYFQK